MMMLLCLPCDIALDRDSRLDIDNSTYVKDHYAVPLTDRIAERARAVIVQVRHVIHGSATTARDLRPETERLRKSQRLGTRPHNTKHC